MTTARASTDKVMGHQHVVTRQAGGNAADPLAYEIGPPRGCAGGACPHLRPDCGSWIDEGNPTAKGISVGKEWDYRSFIEGRTLASAIWTFQGLSGSGLSRVPAARR